MKVLNVAIIGTGVGIRTHLPAFSRIPGVDVRGILGREEDRTLAVAEQFRLPSVFKSIDEICECDDIGLIVVASPNHLHFPHISRALESKKCLLAEKPLAMNFEEASYLLEKQSRLGTYAVVNHQLRFNPFMMRVKEFVNQGMLGRVYHVRIHQQSPAFLSQTAKWNWSFEAASGGGIRLAMASHLVDLFYFLFAGDALVEFEGSLDPVALTRQGPNGVNRISEVSSFFSMSGLSRAGVQVSLTATASGCFPADLSLSIFGDRGELQFDLGRQLRFCPATKAGKPEEVSVPEWVVGEEDKKMSFFALSFLHFAPVLCRAIMTGERVGPIANAASFRDAVETQRLLDQLLSRARRAPDVLGPIM